MSLFMLFFIPNAFAVKNSVEGIKNNQRIIKQHLNYDDYLENDLSLEYTSGLKLSQLRFYPINTNVNQKKRPS